MKSIVFEKENMCMMLPEDCCIIRFFMFRM